MKTHLKAVPLKMPKKDCTLIFIVSSIGN